MIHFPITAEIRADALRANLRAIRQRLPAALPLCAAVKANAYGHGLEQVLSVLAREDVERIAVANLVEGLSARQWGWHRPILCLGSVLAAETEAQRRERAEAIVSANLHCTLTTIDEARSLSDIACRVGRSACIEIKVDTGMGRGGANFNDAAELIAQISGLPGIFIEGVYSHFATADDSDLSFANEQIVRLQSLRTALNQSGTSVRIYHAANSAAIFRMPASHLDMARPGLAVYGYWGGPEHERPADLVPSMRVVGRLTAVRNLPAGHAVGYGRSFTTSRESTIGLVPIGYADGYRRALSNDATMTLEPVRSQPQRDVPVVGRISMDQTTVDLTDAGDVRVGDPVIIIDNDPATANSVEALARKLGTIPYEITCQLGKRLNRVLV